MQRVDVLAIAAHPDDIELTCGGTLIKAVSQGYSVGILDLTQGEMGTRGTPELRAIEAEAARVVIGASFREHMNLGDAKLTASIENRLAVAEKIRQTRPRTVILHHWEARHPDHAASAKLAYEACYAAGLKQMSLPGEPHRPKKILYASLESDLRPSFVVDISPFFTKKMEAVNCFASQFSGDMRNITNIFPGWARLLDRVTTQCKYFGHLADVEYAEPFIVKEMIAIDDVVNLSVASI